MIGILDLIYFPFLNKYIKRYINSFINFKHHLLDIVHQSLTRFYSMSYYQFIKTEFIFDKWIYKMAINNIYNPSISYLSKYRNYTIQDVNKRIDLIQSFYIYKKNHPLHQYLCNLWYHDCLNKYYDLIIEKNILDHKEFHDKAWNIVRIHNGMIGGCAYSN